MIPADSASNLNTIEDDFPNDLLELPTIEIPHTQNTDISANGLETLIDIHRDHKRVLYPVEFYYHRKVNYVRDYCRTAMFLSNLCVGKIAKREDLLKLMLLKLPTTWYSNVMGQTEFYKMFDNSRFLMFNWPFKTFTGLDVFRYYLACPEAFLLNSGRIFVRCLRYFVESLQSYNSPNLRIWDLRGIPIDDEHMSIFTRDLSRLSRDKRLPNGYHVIFDCAIGKSEPILDELTILLRNMRQMAKTKIQLHINKLDIHYSNSFRCWQLLKEVNPRELVGLSVNTGASFYTQLVVLRRFTSLIALKISGRMYPLRHFPELRRLGLESRNFSDTLLNPTAEKLKYLELNRCGTKPMKEADLRHLLSLRFGNLEELNISGQIIVAENLKMWCHFLRSLAPTLRIFQMESCVQDESLLPYLLHTILSLDNLRYLNLSDNALTARMVARDVRNLTTLPKLESIQIPYFRDRELNAFLPPSKNGRSGRDRIENEFKNNKPSPTHVYWSQL